MNYWNQDFERQHNTQPARDSERSQQTLDQEKSSLSGIAEAPIGVFDSGVGGLTILSALREELPNENYIYFGDSANCPYGMRSDAEIIELSIQACRFLVNQGVKLIVVACNTASQAALNSLRATFPSIRFVGVVPAVKPAARATKKGRIGIAATNQAARAIYLQQLIEDFAGGIQAFAVGCPELVTLVERGDIDGLVVEETVKQALDPILKEDVDVIVLGCTHFPALRPVIERVTQNKIHIIDSSNAVARRTHYVLDTEGLIQPDNSNTTHFGNLNVWCSGDAAVFRNVALKLLGYDVNVQQATV
ncbi:MAG TPA: glutamate racemase [Ktedonobacteraceae bacterium]|nr:glutamate racemase [Ktedonobacteraceae bacterium]